MHQGYGDPPPCAACYPQPHDLNLPVLAVWELVQGQWRTGMGGSIALDLVAVNTAMDILRINPEDKPHLARQVLRLGDHILASARAAEEMRSMQAASNKVH